MSSSELRRAGNVFPWSYVSSCTRASVSPPGSQSHTDFLALYENSGRPLKPRQEALRARQEKAHGDSWGRRQNEIQSQFLRESPLAPDCDLQAGLPSASV